MIKIIETKNFYDLTYNGFTIAATEKNNKLWFTTNIGSQKILTQSHSGLKIQLTYKFVKFAIITSGLSIIYQNKKGDIQWSR